MIQSCLPAAAAAPGAAGQRGPGRQTMLFSATVPEAVKSVAHRLLRVGYPMVDTVGKEDTATNPQVTQEVMVRGEGVGLGRGEGGGTRLLTAV